MKVELMPFQLEMLQRDDEKLLIACCGVSSGKSYAASVYIAMKLVQQNTIIAAAQNFTALHRVLFGEVRKRLNEWGIPYEYNKSDKEIRVGEHGVCYGATSENPDAILGMTEVNILVIDEAGYCQENLFNWGSDRLRGRTVTMPRIRLFTSPDSFNAAHAWFVNLCNKNPKAIINASALDNIYTSDEFKADLLERYPPGTQLYEQQILGHIVDSRSANMAIDDRLFAHDRPAHRSNEPVWIGCDLAGAGRDDSVFVAIDDYGFIESRRFHHAETQLLVSELLQMNQQYNVAGVCIDCTGGFGNGLFDYTKRSVKNVDGINFGSAAEDDSFNNLRTEMHFGLRQAVSETNLYLPENDDGAKIREECRYALYFVDNKGRTAMFPKEDIKKAIGRSPDALDALLLAVKARNSSQGIGKHAVDAKAVVQRLLAAHR
jgi:phage terminase large subunit-like protein